MQYSHEATAKRVPGYPLVLVLGSLPGRLVSTPVLENGEVAAAAGDDDNHGNYNCNKDDNNDDDDKDGDDEEEKKRDHQGMARVTTIIGGDRKGKATGEPV